LWGWGYNYDGNLGLGDYDNKCTPVLIQNHTFCDIFLSDNYSMSIDQNNSLWGWGNNYYGQLGCGDYDDKNTPVSVLGNHTFCEISLDYGKVIAIDNNNEVWVWGRYLPGYEITGYLPILINDKTFCDIKIDDFSVYALDNNGQLWGWGYNYNGQLGINNIEQQDIPVEISNHTFCRVYLFKNFGGKS
jgi:alpha-tubulin suppressor-like RCC1 family protein